MSGFEPTEAQSGVGYNYLILIDPDEIPYPETDTWSLNYAAETIRSGGEELASLTEAMESTWQGLQEHYEAPEAETLFAAVAPVATSGEGLETDLATVATALEDLAEAATEARRKLNSLRIEAQAFVNGLKNRECWWLTKDDDNDEWSLETNFRLKSDVNSAWSDFTTAEIACSNAISGIYGGAVYTNPDDATGSDNELVYGESRLMFDPGDDVTSAVHATVAWSLDNATEWAGQNLNPESVQFDNSMGQAAWDTLMLGVVWGGVQGAVTKTGYWHPENGWASSNDEYVDNLKMTWTDAALDAAALIGVRNEDGWLYDPRSDNPAENLSWGWWWDNAKNSGAEVWEGHSAWSKHESDPAYTWTHTTINSVMLLTGPFKLGVEVLGFGNGRSGDGSGIEGGSEAGPFGGQGSFSGTGGSERDIADILNDGRTPITERFGDVLEQNSTLPPVTPDRPSTPPSSGPADPVAPPPGQNPTSQPSTQQDSIPQSPTQQSDARSGAGNDTSRDGDQRSEDTPRTDRESQDSDQNRDGTGRIREDGDDQTGTGRGGNEPNESRSENDPDRQNQSNDDQAVPPRTEDRGTDDGASSTSNNETTSDRGNTSEDSISNSDQQNPGDGSNNGGGSSGNGGGDGGSPGDPSTGGAGDGSRPPSPKTLAQFKTHRWNGDQDAFFRDLENLINDPNNKDVLREYYQEKDGHRHSIHTRVGAEELPLPKITKDPNTGRWTPLASPIPPNFLGDNIKMALSDKNFLNDKLSAKEYHRREDLRLRFNQLQWLAEERQISIDATKSAETKLQEAESEHGKYEKGKNNHPDVVKAKKEYDRLNTEMSISSELLGEKSADLGARFVFDGDTLKDSKGNPVQREVIDSNGNKTLVDIQKPDLTGAVLLDPSPLAPDNGNNQFDLIYRTKDGIVIVEAKSSKHTDLGETTHYPRSGKPVKVMQGRREYALEIASRMRSRGEKSLAREIERGISDESLVYALFKGNPDVARGENGSPIIESEKTTPIADGFFYRLFDIYNWRA